MGNFPYKHVKAVTTPQGVRRRGVQTNLPLIEVITQGNMEHGGKTNNTGCGRQGDTRLKNTRKLIKEKQKQVRSN